MHFFFLQEEDSVGPNLSPFHFPASNTDVKSGGAWPSCDKKVLCMRTRARRQPPSH